MRLITYAKMEMENEHTNIFQIFFGTIKKAINLYLSEKSITKSFTFRWYYKLLPTNSFILEQKALANQVKGFLFMLGWLLDKLVGDTQIQVICRDDVL